MKFTEIPAPYFDLAMTLDSGQVFHWKKVRIGRSRLLDRCMVSTRSDELRPEIGTTKSRKRNETNRAAVRVAKCKVAVQLRLMITTVVGTSIAKELTLPQTSG
jgi:hypothetical protein